MAVTGTLANGAANGSASGERGNTVAGPSGGFVDFRGERYYCIIDVDHMPPFFISLVCAGDHWLFIASNGGLTLGRVSPETALFPYVTVDRIYESTPHTGPLSLLRVQCEGAVALWEPFKVAHEGRYRISRNLYRNAAGSKLVFEEINQDLELAFRYGWRTSEAYGFCRDSEVENLGSERRELQLLDGLQNLLPAGTPRGTQARASYLVDAYKRAELDVDSGLGMFTLNSAITDRAEPAESLRASTVFQLGLQAPATLLSSRQLEAFKHRGKVTTESHTRGLRGAYFVSVDCSLDAGGSKTWRLVADLERSQVDCVDLLRQLADPVALGAALEQSIARADGELAGIMGSADGFQRTADEMADNHHYTNVVFNVLRGGIFADGYAVGRDHLAAHLRHFNLSVWTRHRALLDALPPLIDREALLARASGSGDAALERLCYEYLPITFGRRHGDPSRPWNEFAIVLRDQNGDRLLRYQGNWRDIFQNWETLLVSFPGFAEHVIARFVNATTADGYNPYRVTSEGFEWEVEEPDDPWSYIGYWGDHQIIYLLKLLELSQRQHPRALPGLLRREIFSYANVPYRIRPFEQLLDDPKTTVDYDQALANEIAQRVARMGADGQLLLDADGQVYHVNLTEKLLVPLLAKLANLVPEGGIWLNTQRPEWNDANNALVGNGLSMVTLYYIRRYLVFLQALLANEREPVTLSSAVAAWLHETAAAIDEAATAVESGPLDDALRLQLTARLGTIASDYRTQLYRDGGLTGKTAVAVEQLGALLSPALRLTNHSIAHNRRDDGMYHAYNLLHRRDGQLGVDHLYLMLEGQVAALSSGALCAEDALALLRAMYASPLYREDQHTFMLYPDREPEAFLSRNRVPEQAVMAIPLLKAMLDNRDRRLIERDVDGHCRFNADLRNAGDLAARLVDCGAAPDQAESVLALYETVFRHREFTGRSGTMFAFEGLGSIYWHMVGKLLLAVQECFFRARETGAADATCRELGEFYYRIRAGLGCNKTPADYGGFPADPYSHTPSHLGAQQPGMTGQVKEEILSRFGELGVSVIDGEIRFDVSLLRRREFIGGHAVFRYRDVADQRQELPLEPPALAFTYCQVPVCYRLQSQGEPGIRAVWSSGEIETLPGAELPSTLAAEVFRRSGRVSRIDVSVMESSLFGD
jgi:hypothetical protein